MPTGAMLNRAECCGCGACLNICPQTCIRLTPDAEGFPCPEIDRSACIGCNRCHIVCPVYNRPGRVAIRPTACHADDLPACGTTDLLFHELAAAVLSRGGAVFGSRFDPERGFMHDFTSDAPMLYDYEGWKPVQSLIGGAFKKISELLENGTAVLFAGTPCEIAGLRNYLNTDNLPLICVTRVCCGVASPTALCAYIHSLERNHGVKVQNIHFGAPPDGLVTLCLEGGEVLRHPVDEDAFIAGYRAGLFLRPSCCVCPLRYAPDGSDIVLGLPARPPRPASTTAAEAPVVLVNTPEGDALFSSVQSGRGPIRPAAVTFGPGNPAVAPPPVNEEKRDFLFEYLDSDDFEALIDTLTRPGPVKKAARRMLQIFLSSSHRLMKFQRFIRLPPGQSPGKHG